MVVSVAVDIQCTSCYDDLTTCSWCHLDFDPIKSSASPLFPACGFKMTMKVARHIQRGYHRPTVDKGVLEDRYSRAYSTSCCYLGCCATDSAY